MFESVLDVEAPDPGWVAGPPYDEYPGEADVECGTFDWFDPVIDSGCEVPPDPGGEIGLVSQELNPHQVPLPPAAGRLAALDGLRPDKLDADEALEAATGWERLIAYAQAQQVRLLARFADLRPGEEGRHVSEFAADEIALELRLTCAAAARRLALARDLATRLPDTLAALDSGRVDLARAQLVSELTSELPDSLARQVEAEVLDRAESQNTSQLRATVRRAIIRLDPEGAEIRRRERCAHRRVSAYPCSDGMAGLDIYGPAPAVVAAHSYLDRLAWHSRAAGDDRTLDQLRADHALNLLTGRRTDAPARAHAGAGVDTTAGVDGRGGQAGTDADGTASQEAPQDPDAVRVAGPGLPPRPPPADAATVRTPGQPPGEARPVSAQVQVTVAAATLLGLDDEPAELAGYGPISAEAARELARDATWRRLLTDPTTGSLIDYGRRTYRPPAALADHVRARDTTCVFPACTRPARGCDLDHTKPYPSGPTSAGNLGSLCRHHHRLKHHPGWELSQADDATFTWTTPARRVHVQQPTPVLEPRRSRPRRAAGDAWPPWDP
jgi:Domain of unknown function (DUF222)